MKNLDENTKKFAEFCKNKLELENSTDITSSYYKSLPICIIDAVFSIGIKYKIVKNVVDRYIKYYNLNISRQEQSSNEHTINDFLNNINSFKSIDDFSEVVVKNKNRTSSQNGILKAEACVRVAEVFKKHSINTMNDFKTYKNKEGLNRDILNVKGQSSGIMLKYLYMLTGDESLAKPDRWIERFIQQVCPEIKTQEEIQEIMQSTVKYLKPEFPSITVRKLDGLIWTYQTTKKDKNEHSPSCELVQ